MHPLEGAADSVMNCITRLALRMPGLLLGGLLALWPAVAQGLDPSRLITQYGHDVWLTRDGLPQNSVRAIVQTRDGYLWLGTWGGLARFDGVRFTIFSRANTPALRDSRITALTEDVDGSLWIGTAAGGLVRLKNGAFETYRSEGDTSYEERSRWQIRSIARSSDGALWIGTSGGGFRHFKNGRFSRLLMDRLVVRAILEDNSRHLWVATSSGVLELSWTEPDTFHIERHLLGDHLVNGLYQDRSGAIWIAARGGLTRVEGQRVTTFGSAEGFPGDAALSIWQDRDGNLWVGTDGDGLVRMRGGQVDTLGARRFDRLEVRHGLSGASIAALYEDREGSLWIGSNDGLNRLRDTRFTALTMREGLSADAVNSLLAARDGTVWIGTDGGGLNRLHGAGISVYTTARGLPTNYPGALFEASDGTIWTSGDGVVMRQRGESRRVYSAADGVPKGFVSTIGEDRYGRIIIGGEGPIRELKNDRFVVYPHQAGQIEYCYSITRDRRGDLWFATTGGLVHVGDGGHRTYTTRDGLPDEGVHSIYEDRDGTLWVATVGGLARLKEGAVASFSKAGLLGEIVFEILEDAAGNLWMNGRQGIIRAAKRDLEDYAAKKRSDVPLTVYGIADGLKSTEYREAYIQRPACRTSDGRLWFATAGGVATIDPAVSRVNGLAPPVLIEAIVSDGAPVAPGPLQTRPGAGAFEVQYTALSFLAPSQMRFAYRLENLDPGWIDAGTRRTASYSRVPPGQYRFRVRAANNDGIWNEAGVALDIRVPPHFYQTRWFRVSVVVMLVLVAVGLHQLRVRRMEAQFSLVMKERNRIAREIHDSLAQGLAAIGLHLSAIQSDRRDIWRERHVQKAQQLVEANLAEARRSIWDLHPQYLDRHDLVSGLGRLAADLGENPNIRITTRVSGTARALTADVEKNVFRIAQEAVANAIRHAAAGRIDIEVSFERDHVRITVSDDGLGFDPPAVSSGFGLTSMRERAAQIGAAFLLESRPQAGTSVSVTVPAGSPDRSLAMARVRAMSSAMRGRAGSLLKIISRLRAPGRVAARARLEDDARK
jgi:signal transduction histidine kinase/ligand-binding sensor domain-containing protein